MAYSGWLVKVGDFIIDTKKYIKAETYSAYVNMQDVGSWTYTNCF